MKNGDKVLVTGASGFVGSAIARLLIERGALVRVLIRPTSSRKNLEGLPFEIIEGDITNFANMNAALRDVRYLFHVAADYRLWAPHPTEIMRTNVEGTRIVMEAAHAQHVERIVYTSSVATLDLRGAEGASVDETSPLEETRAIGAYKQSKVAAERLVERMIVERRLPAVIVNPSTPVGPRDVRPTPTGRIIIEAASGRIPAFVDTGLNLVHVDDVAIGHLLALERGQIGNRYILGGENVAFGQMLAAIANLVGRKPPRLRLPRWPLYPLAYGAEMTAQMTGKEPFITVDGLKMAKHQMFFSSARASSELGYSARPYIEGLSSALDWFRDAGYLTR